MRKKSWGWGTGTLASLSLRTGCVECRLCRVMGGGVHKSHSPSCLPSITQRPEMPASLQPVPVILGSAAQRSSCGPAVRAAEPTGDSRPCHFLCALRSSAWLRAGARLWRRRRGRSGKPLSAFMWAGGSRHARLAHAHSLPGAGGSWSGGDNVLTGWLLQGSKRLPLGRHVVPSRRCSAAGLL